MTDEKYPIINFFGDKEVKFVTIATSIIIVFILIFFNNNPSSQFELWIDSFLIKGRGFYSPSYAFNSIIIANYLMVITPMMSIITVLIKKTNYFTRDEIIKNGWSIQENTFKAILAKFILLPFMLSLMNFILFFIIYVDFANLEEVKIRTSFIGDNIVSLFSLSMLCFVGFYISLTWLLTLLFHPIILFKSQIRIPYESRDKKSLLKKYYREKRNKSQ